MGWRREDKDPIAGLGAPTPHYSKEEGKKGFYELQLKPSFHFSVSVT